MTAVPFRLEKVLRVRKLELDRACVALATAERDLYLCRAARAERARHASDSAAVLAERARGGVLAAEYRAAALDVEVGHAGIREAIEQERTAEAAVEAAHNVVLMARTRVRALERLREKSHEAARKRGEHKLQQELDEIGVQRAFAHTGGHTT